MWTSAPIKMAKTNFRSVEEYIASQPKAAQDVLELVRTPIRKAVPRAEEVISYHVQERACGVPGQKPYDPLSAFEACPGAKFLEIVERPKTLQ